MSHNVLYGTFRGLQSIYLPHIHINKIKILLTNKIEVILRSPIISINYKLF